jgi:hypothetical protein
MTSASGLLTKPGGKQLDRMPFAPSHSLDTNIEVIQQSEVHGCAFGGPVSAPGGHHVWYTDQPPRSRDSLNVRSFAQLIRVQVAKTVLRVVIEGH